MHNPSQRKIKSNQQKNNPNQIELICYSDSKESSILFILIIEGLHLKSVRCMRAGSKFNYDEDRQPLLEMAARAEIDPYYSVRE